MRPLHIRLVDARKSFTGAAGPFAVLDGLSLDIARGELVTFFGPNGCGKSTLLNVIARTEPLDAGSVAVESTSEVPRVGFIFQDYRGNLMPWLTVAENIELPLRIRNVRPRERREQVEALARRFDFHVDLEAKTYTLSGGQAQLTSILRALIIDPEILLMDEPFSALDYQTNLFLYDKLLHVWETASVTILFISHDIDEALFLGERTVFLTRRPAHVAAILENHLGRPKQLDQMGSPAFADLKRQALAIFQREATAHPD
jgi:NitT/TauT family transport system ATP-binding protein